MNDCDDKDFVLVEQPRTIDLNAIARESLAKMTIKEFFPNQNQDVTPEAIAKVKELYPEIDDIAGAMKQCFIDKKQPTACVHAFSELPYVPRHVCWGFVTKDSSIDLEYAKFCHRHLAALVLECYGVRMGSDGIGDRPRFDLVKQ